MGKTTKELDIFVYISLAGVCKPNSQEQLHSQPCLDLFNRLTSQFSRNTKYSILSEQSYSLKAKPSHLLKHAQTWSTARRPQKSWPNKTNTWGGRKQPGSPTPGVSSCRLRLKDTRGFAPRAGGQAPGDSGQAWGQPEGLQSRAPALWPLRNAGRWEAAETRNEKSALKFAWY